MALRKLRNALGNLRRRPGNTFRRWRHRHAVVSRFKSMYLEYQSNPARYSTQAAQSLLREAFIASRGESLEWAWQIQQARTPPKSLTADSKLFPGISDADADILVNALRVDGFAVLPQKMPAEWVEAVTDQAQQLPVASRGAMDDVQLPASIRPTSPTYWHSDSDIIAIPEVRDFLTDRTLRTIAARYLKCEPVLDLIASWWTFPFGEADSASAQLYHFDLDRVRWVKVFVYLTDVTEHSGPHAFIRGSHRTIGKRINRDGRFTDEEVFALYPKSDEHIFVAPKGTVIIEDTLGFHKGVPATQGHRFILEYELSINHFGYPYPALPIDV